MHVFIYRFDMHACLLIYTAISQHSNRIWKETTNSTLIPSKSNMTWCEAYD